MVRFAARLTAIVLIAAIAGWYLTTQGDTLITTIDRIGPAGLLTPFVLGILYWLSLGLLWGDLQERLGGGLPLASATRIWAISTVARYVPGNLWHIAGRTALVATAGGAPFAAITASVYEQVVTLAGALLVAGIALPLAGGAAYLPALLAVPAALIVLSPPVQAFIAARAARLAKQPAILSTAQLSRVIAGYALPCLPAGLALWLLAPAASPLGAIGAFAAAWSIGYASFLTPSGLGVREVALAAALAVVAPGVDGAAVAVVHRLVLTVAEFTVALACGLLPARTAANG